MFEVLHIDNPFELHIDHVRRDMVEATTVRGALEVLYPGFTEFEHPTICLVNSEPYLRARWSETLPPDARIAFVRLAGGVVEAIIWVVVVIVAVAVTAVVMKTNPSAIGAGDGPGEQKNGDTVYSLSGEKNQVRLNASIESAYGTNRLWPSYAAIPYNTYDGNQQFQYSLFCLGHGWFSIGKMQFENTPIQNFDDVEFEIVNPGESFDLFADNVVTSTAVGGIELYGPNEKEYSGPTGGFVTNEPFTKANRIEVDVTLPAGLYKLNDDGDPEKQDVSVNFQYRSINDSGAPTGPWRPLTFTKRKIKVTIPNNDIDVPVQINGVDVGAKTVYEDITVPYFFKDLATLTPQRFTLSAKVTPGRYEVRAQRVNKKNTNARSGNIVRWEALRAFFPSVKFYGDVTLIAIKARASNNLNNNAAQRFNVIATRKLPIWNPTTGWSAKPQATRSIVWAFADIFRATYGGRLGDEFLALQSLYELHLQYAEEKWHFDYIFDQRTTVWEAARAVARAGRAVPMLNGSQIYMIRDRLQTTATAVFNQHNIVKGSLVWNVKLVNVEDYDGIEVEYMDNTTWQPETVLCLIGSDQGDNPEKLKLPGVTDRARAYQEGLYARAVQLYARENIEFRTGLEGHLPRYGDLVLISHDVPRWGSGGVVKSIDGAVVNLSDPVTFLEGATHKLILRKNDGTAYGPVTVTAGANSRQVVADGVITEDFYFDSTHEPPYYLFGEESFEAKRGVIVGITPDGEDTVTIRCANYDVRIFSFAGAPTPDRYAPPVRVVEPERPVVKEILVRYIPSTNEFVLVSWPPALGARTYILEASEDAVHWSRMATTPNTVVQMRVQHPGSKLYMRVAGVGVDIGPWTNWQGKVGNVPAIPSNVTGLHLTNLGPGFATVAWNLVANADGYALSMFEKPTGKWLRTTVIYTNSSTYTLDFGDIDGLVGREVLFRVRGVNIRGQSEDTAQLTVLIPERAEPFDPITADASKPTSDTTTTRADHS